MPPPVYFPATQSAQVLAATSPGAESLPWAQSVQLDWPVLAKYLPAAHSVQLETPPAEILPASQSVQAEAAAAEYLPDAQLPDTAVRPVTAQYEDAVQDTHAPWPAVA